MPFATIKDIADVSQQPDGCVLVRWQTDPELWVERESESQPGELIHVLNNVRQIATSIEPGCLLDVYLNGQRHSTLQGPVLEASAEELCNAVARLHSAKLCIRHSARHGILRVERYFKGMVRGEELFEHVLDNLVALEDPQIIDADTIIGTATLPDWIMGGELTSRLWVRDLGDGILALRPLYNDHVDGKGEVDRRYELREGRNQDDDRRIALLRRAVSNVRYLAALAAKAS